MERGNPMISPRAPQGAGAVQLKESYTRTSTTYAKRQVLTVPCLGYLNLYSLLSWILPMPQNQTDLRPIVSAKDLAMILSAIGAYSHNTEFRDLRDRLQHQAVTWGVFRAT